MQARHFGEAARDLQYTLLEQEAAAMIAKQQQNKVGDEHVGWGCGTKGGSILGSAAVYAIYLALTERP